MGRGGEKVGRNKCYRCFFCLLFFLCVSVKLPLNRLFSSPSRGLFLPFPLGRCYAPYASPAKPRHPSVAAFFLFLFFVPDCFVGVVVASFFFLLVFSPLVLSLFPRSLSLSFSPRESSRKKKSHRRRRRHFFLNQKGGGGEQGKKRFFLVQNHKREKRGE